MKTTTKKNAEITKPNAELSRDPFRMLGLPSVSRMRREFDELFNRFFSDVPAMWAAERGDERWSFDVEDHPDAYVIKAEAPGFEPKDFSVDLRGNQLIMQATKQERKREDKHQSFTTAELYRSLTIPDHVDPSKIDASYRQGVLRVSLPKTAEGRGRHIEVKD